MAYSRQHYEGTATDINKVAYMEHMDVPTLTLLAATFAERFIADNERFDKERFFAACFQPREV